MIRKLIITETEYGILSAVSEDGLIVSMQAEKQEGSILGNIYLARVKNILKNIEAAFVEADNGLICYLPLEDCRFPVFSNAKRDQVLRENDELLVQVVKEAGKTKGPVVTANLSMTGKYTVVTTGRRRLSFSGKLTMKEKQSLKELLTPWHKEHPEFGLIARTNARDASPEQIFKELSYSVKSFERLLEIAVHRTCPMLLKKGARPCLSLIRDTYSDSLMQITTDSLPVYEDVREFLGDFQPEDLDKLALYQDASLSLFNLYRFRTFLQTALSKKVWLKSGGYLVIEQTEALTVIDVNTGKYTGKKKLQDTFLKINLEAAKELAYQLRVRNLSGIIVVDFIDMDSADADKKLLDQLEGYLKQDPVKTTLVDMTALHLAEITRKKTRATLAEQLSGTGITNLIFDREAGSGQREEKP